MSGGLSMQRLYFDRHDGQLSPFSLPATLGRESTKYTKLVSRSSIYCRVPRDVVRGLGPREIR